MCCRSNGYGSGLGYGNNEACSITVSGSGLIKATTFDTEAGWDILTIDGSDAEYSGSAGDSGPNNLVHDGVMVQDGASIQWHSDGSVVRDGFEVCGVL